MAMERLKATFGIGRKEKSVEGVIVDLPGVGARPLKEVEERLYRRLFVALDVMGCGVIEGRDAAPLLKRTGLPRPTLAEIWRLASGGTAKASLNQKEWYLACLLTAAAQGGMSVSIASLAPTMPHALVNFHITSEVETMALSVQAVRPSSIGVMVTDPTFEGSGLTKHTSYLVKTTTSLPQFPRKDMVVRRRFRDFAWLHSRVCSMYPGASIPILPAKKSVGNMGPAFIEARRASLSMYIDKLVHHPYLVLLLDVRVFLEASVEGLQAFQDVVAQADKELPETSFIDSVLGAVGKSEGGGPIKASDEFVARCSVHVAALANMGKCVTAVRAMHASNRALASGMSTLGTLLEGLSSVESMGAKAGSAAMVTYKVDQSGRLDTKGTAADYEAPAAEDSERADLAAAAVGGEAFARHRAAEKLAIAAAGGGTVDDMFGAQLAAVDSGGFDAATVLSPDRGATHRSISASESKADKRSSVMAAVPVAESSTDLFAASGHSFVSLGRMMLDQLDRFEVEILSPMETDFEKECELNEANARRMAIVNRLQKAQEILTRRKRAFSTARAGTDGAKQARTEAELHVAMHVVERRQKDLDFVTQMLSAEMAKTDVARQSSLAVRGVLVAKQLSLACRNQRSTLEQLLPALGAAPKEPELTGPTVPTTAAFGDSTLFSDL